jgi:hypothetical protein
MSKNSSKQRVEQLQSWISWVKYTYKKQTKK